VIAWRLNRSFAWNAAHPPKLPPRPRRLPTAPLRLFDHTLECPIGIAASALPNSRWIEAYARPEGLVRALGGMRRRFGLAPFSEEERERLAAAIGTLEERAERAAEEILGRWGAGEIERAAVQESGNLRD